MRKQSAVILGSKGCAQTSNTNAAAVCADRSKTWGGVRLVGAFRVILSVDAYVSRSVP